VSRLPAAVAWLDPTNVNARAARECGGRNATSHDHGSCTGLNAEGACGRRWGAVLGGLRIHDELASSFLSSWPPGSAWPAPSHRPGHSPARQPPRRYRRDPDHHRRHHHLHRIGTRWPRIDRRGRSSGVFDDSLGAAQHRSEPEPVTRGSLRRLAGATATVGHFLCFDSVSLRLCPRCRCHQVLTA
jgi:hypothetical protein